MVKESGSKTEKVLWEGKPSTKLIVSSVIGCVFWIAALYIFISLIARNVNALAFSLVIGFFAVYSIISIIYQYFVIKSYRYTITSEEVISEGGILTKFRRRVPYHKITDTTIRQGPVDQILGIYTLALQTAGMGLAIAEIRFKGLTDCATPEKIVKDQIKKVRGAVGE